MTTVDIHFDNVNDVFFPGQTISGRVECFFPKEKTLRAIRIKFKGRSKTLWRVKRGKNTTTYTASEVYFCDERNLVSAHEDTLKLPAGRHVYAFSYNLPQTLPSSFRDKHGEIYYSIKATVDRPWKFDHEQKVVFNVIAPLDLNYMPQLRQPVSDSLDKEISSCCWTSSGPIMFNMSIPIGGYVPNQDISIGAFVRNMSNINIEIVEFSIFQIIQYIATHPRSRTKLESMTLRKCQSTGIGAHGEKSWTSILSVPNIAYPNCNGCNIIDVSYIVQGLLRLPFMHSNLELNLPIIIGMVPLADVQTYLPGAPPLPQESDYSNVAASTSLLSNGSFYEATPLYNEI